MKESDGGMLLKYKTGIEEYTKTDRLPAFPDGKVDKILSENKGELSFEFDKSIAA